MIDLCRSGPRRRPARTRNYGSPRPQSRPNGAHFTSTSHPPLPLRRSASPALVDHASPRNRHPDWLPLDRWADYAASMRSNTGSAISITAAQLLSRKLVGDNIRNGDFLVGADHFRSLPIQVRYVQRSNAARIASLSLGSCSLQRNPICRPTAEVGMVTMLSQLITES